ncbi:thioredoxin [Penicillium odoratum]|uniref:thioredoxin n=1 Tax=Penicillium odoratum TaxID=1167516 RepID=UPI002549BFC2|nr:thioredoxin [Penicillium odoratum]KAJ5746157.1 thioredoxin [Penicillium odoratum]
MPLIKSKDLFSKITPSTLRLTRLPLSRATSSLLRFSVSQRTPFLATPIRTFSSTPIPKFSHSIPKMGGKVELITTEADFQAKVTDSKDAIIVDFFAEWCGPCKAIAPVLEKFSEKHENVKFYKVDVDQLGEVAAKNKISAMPTFLVFKNGELIDTVRGAVPPAIEAAIVKVSA